MPLLTSRSAQSVLKRAPGDPKRGSRFPGAPPREPGIPPLPLDVPRGGVSSSALHPVPPEESTPTRDCPMAPDSHTLQPKFNFQLQLLTLDRERSKLEGG